MYSSALLVLCVFFITQLNGAVITGNDRSTFMGYFYEKPAIAFDLPQDWVKMKPVVANHNTFEPTTAGGIGHETLVNGHTNKEVAIPPSQVENASEGPDTDVLAIDLRGNFDEVEFQYPSSYFNSTPAETNFEHQELGSQHASHHRGPVKRIKFKGALQNFNFSTYTGSLKGCGKTVETTAVNQVDWRPKSNQRPPNRRIAPYMDVSTDEAYFHQ